jgi:hypothetical protein
MGVQFVQIGDEKEAKRELKELVKGDNGVRQASRNVNACH